MWLRVGRAEPLRTRGRQDRSRSGTIDAFTRSSGRLAGPRKPLATHRYHAFSSRELIHPMSQACSAAACVPAEFSSQQFRQALGQFATGVTVVTACSAAGERVGLTVSSFNSVSLEPPLVLWSLNRTSHSMAAFATVSHYVIHVLGADQQALGERFAGPREQRWEDLPHDWSEGGAPLLRGCLAVFECADHSRHAAGDHVIFVAEVTRCASASPRAPLLYHGSRFHPGLASSR